jgi:hypothetical protein
MKPPFTIEQFFAVFKAYNLAVFPLQIIFYLGSLIAIYLTIKSYPLSGKIISGLLSLLWLWMGIVYHIIFFATINKVAYLFGGLFITQGILFFVFSLFQDKFSFHFKKDTNGVTGMLLILFSLIIYPITGYLFGHIYPFSPTFGLPCPTTIFTFGLLLLNVKRTPIIILVIPFVWSIIGFMAAFQLGIVEDASLLIAGLFTAFLLIYRDRILSKKVEVSLN